MAEKDYSDIEKLNYHLMKLLDLELERPAETVDIPRISRILELAELCGGYTDTGDLEAFAGRFNRRYRTELKPLRPQKPNLAQRLMKLAACLVLFAVLFCTAEFVAVNAFGVSIVQMLQEWGDSVQNYVDKFGGKDEAVEKSLEMSKRGKIILPQTEIDMAKDFYLVSGYGEKEAEALALQYVKETNALYQEAVANGYTVSDQEIRDYLEEQKEQYQTADNKEEIYAFMERFESEQAYWDFQFEIYKKDLPIQKYNAAREREFMQEQAENGSIDKTGDLWAEEFERQKARAVEKYDFAVE